MPNFIRALTIAGFDGSGGAGIQADIKTFSALGCYAMSALTALPVQNTTGVKNIYELPLSFIKEQCEAIFEDIGVDVVKIGMLFNSDVIGVVSDILLKYKPKLIVVDPVMVAKSGDSLLKADAINALVEKIFPLSTIITPNMPEASQILGQEIEGEGDMIDAAVKLACLGSKAVIVKGGHAKGEFCRDLLYLDGVRYRFGAKRISTINNHGTGCTFSAAIAAFLGHGYTIPEAAKKAKIYITGALNAAKDYKIGKGHGPVHHFYDLWKEKKYVM
jgi:hydroxymethylpyrimidine/phosphomethylpyrimidine kinase